MGIKDFIEVIKLLIQEETVGNRFLETIMNFISKSFGK